MTTLEESIAAYRTIARADSKSEHTVQWVCDSSRYLKEFLGDGVELEEITVQDIRRWIVGLRELPRFANHPTPLLASGV